MELNENGSVLLSADEHETMIKNLGVALRDLILMNAALRGVSNAMRLVADDDEIKEHLPELGKLTEKIALDVEFTLSQCIALDAFLKNAKIVNEAAAAAKH